MPALMQCRLPSGGASARVLPDLLRHPHYAGLVWRFDLFVVGGNERFRHNKISGALEPERNFGESVEREARGARRVLVERDAHGLTRWSANGSDCRH